MLLMFQSVVIIRDRKSPHRYAAMACLVTGVYRLEKDRKHRGGLLFPSEVDTGTAIWWKHFKYELVEMLIHHSKTGSPTIFGAVYRSSHGHAPTGPPNIVIAFRGTMMRRADWEANLMIYLGRLECNPRFTEGLNAVKRAVKEVGWESVCVTGHSKGAAIGLLVGRAMAEKGKLIEAHLFNPPHPTVRTERPLGSISALRPSRWLVGSVELIHEVSSRALSALTQETEVVEEERKRFESLSQWRPSLYVNTHDPICSAYITFFRAAQYLPPHLRRLAGTPYSIRQSILSIVGVDSRPHHLIPRAMLFIRTHHNYSSHHDLTKPHKLMQWVDVQPSNVQALDARRDSMNDDDAAAAAAAAAAEHY